MELQSFSERGARKLGTVLATLCKRLPGLRRKTPGNGEDLRLKFEYFNIATHYYVAGRYAVFAGMIPTAGNLFHHAIEMYLKGCLCRFLGEGERRLLGHALRRLWRRFRTDSGDPTLEKYDRMIKELDKFESIRYPERTARRGMLAEFAFERPDPNRLGAGPGRPEPRYLLVVEEIDQLVTVLFQKARVNHRVFQERLGEAGQTYLQRGNISAIWQG